MNGTTLALIFVLGINAMFFFGQEAVCDVNPSGCSQFFNYEGSHIARYDVGNYTLQTDTAERLPTTLASVSPTTGNIFTDAWSATINWLSDNTGLSYLIAIVNTVPNFLKSIGLPATFAFGLGYMWYAFSVFVIVLFIRGIVD